MSLTALIADGLQLMLIGMGIVFTFLILLVGILKLMSQLAKWLDDQFALPVPVSNRSSLAQGACSSSSDPELVAVISAAVSRYRQNHR